MKNFIRIKNPLVGERMLLMNIHTSEMYEPFEDYVELLIDKGYASNTIALYAGHVSRFLDFLYELRLVSLDMGVEFEPVKAFSLYQDFLTLGHRSSIELIQTIARNIGKSNETSFRSIANGIEASLSLFMELKLFNENEEYFIEVVSTEIIFSHRELSKMARNSWLEATKRSYGRKSKRQIKLFNKAARRNSKSSTKIETKEKAKRSFPISKIVNFFVESDIKSTSSFSTIRDYLLYSLLAASGVRQSEALQVTVDDIDWDNMTIYIISPAVRNYSGLTSAEATALCDKGRATSETFLIQPFAHIFWSILKIYMKHHYKENVNHRFLFQKYNGRPFFNSDRSERSKKFKSRLKQYDPDLAHLNLHGFRHTYGFYTLNYFPIVDQFGNPTGRQGLPMAYVKLLMGHQNINSTEVYARQDLDLVEFMLAAANSYIRDNNISLTDMAKQYYDRQIINIEHLKSELDKDGV